MRPIRFPVLLLTAAMIGCSSVPHAGGFEGPPRHSHVLTQEEMLASSHQDLFHAVSSLRAQWMRQRGQISMASPRAGRVQVFLDGVRVGDVSFLRQINVRDVRSLQYLSAPDATSRFGLQTNAGPVIVIDTWGGR